MAKRALAFGARFKSEGRSVTVRKDARSRSGYEVEVQRSGKSAKRRQHGDLRGALADFAASWRARHH